jgi:hypothetical protein
VQNFKKTKVLGRREYIVLCLEISISEDKLLIAYCARRKGAGARRIHVEAPWFVLLMARGAQKDGAMQNGWLCFPMNTEGCARHIRLDTRRARMAYILECQRVRKKSRFCSQLSN